MTQECTVVCYRKVKMRVRAGRENTKVTRVNKTSLSKLGLTVFSDYIVSLLDVSYQGIVNNF